MSEPTELPEADFDTQLQSLFQEAEQKIQGRKAAMSGKAEAERESIRTEGERKDTGYASLPQMLRPIMLGLEALSRATGENAMLLQKLDKKAEAADEAQNDLPQLVSGLETLLEQKNGINQRMFDALHEELKGYKDGFLMESVLRPIVRDLISLYDDLSTIGGQMQECVAMAGSAETPPLSENLRNVGMNLRHHTEFVLEILERLEVTMLPVGVGKLDKQCQRAVLIEPTEDAELDMTVVRSVKRGFVWKQRVMRAEEVVMRRLREGRSSLASS